MFWINSSFDRDGYYTHTYVCTMTFILCVLVLFFRKSELLQDQKWSFLSTEKGTKLKSVDLEPRTIPDSKSKKSEHCSFMTYILVHGFYLKDEGIVKREPNSKDPLLFGSTFIVDVRLTAWQWSGFCLIHCSNSNLIKNEATNVSLPYCRGPVCTRVPDSSVWTLLPTRREVRVYFWVYHLQVRRVVKWGLTKERNSLSYSGWDSSYIIDLIETKSGRIRR